MTNLFLLSLDVKVLFDDSANAWPFETDRDGISDDTRFRVSEHDLHGDWLLERNWRSRIKCERVGVKCRYRHVFELGIHRHRRLRFGDRLLQGGTRNGEVRFALRRVDAGRVAGTDTGDAAGPDEKWNR